MARMVLTKYYGYKVVALRCIEPETTWEVHTEATDGRVLPYDLRSTYVCDVDTLAVALYAAMDDIEKWTEEAEYWQDLLLQNN